MLSTTQKLKPISRRSINRLMQPLFATFPIRLIRLIIHGVVIPRISRCSRLVLMTIRRRLLFLLQRILHLEKLLNMSTPESNIYTEQEIVEKIASLERDLARNKVLQKMNRSAIRNYKLLLKAVSN